MFDNLTNRLSKILDNMRGRGRFTEENIKSIIREIRISLLEADVALEVVNDFINKIKKNIIGCKITATLTPSQEFTKIVKNELILLLGHKNISLNLSSQPPIVILIAGLQGVGKTTTVAKLAKILKEKNKKKVILVSTDIYRPAAITQLEYLSKQIKVDFYKTEKNQKPNQIIKNVIHESIKNFYDIILVDTAGRLHIDDYMMQEIQQIHLISKPIETIFVLDAMIGQEAANIAKKFNDKIPITGIILTKIDGDMRGGAALSVCHITKKPIKFICNGEKIDDIELFYPDRIASSILGMGDVFSLIEDIENRIYIKNKKDNAKNLKNNKFDLNDFLEQIRNMRNMGGINNLLQKIPFLHKINNENFQDNEKVLLKMEAVINSMTKKERLYPEIIKSSQKKRISVGSGVKIQDINRLLKQFESMKSVIKKIKKSGISKTINSIKSMMNYIR